jgi:hypothetical protein
LKKEKHLKELDVSVVLNTKVCKRAFGYGQEAVV